MDLQLSRQNQKYADAGLSQASSRWNWTRRCSPARSATAASRDRRWFMCHIRWTAALHCCPRVKEACSAGGVGVGSGKGGGETGMEEQARALAPLQP